VDEIVKRAFDIANYAETFSAQKNILKEEFNQALILFQNGGTFTITKELICFVKILIDLPNNKTAVLVDDNHSPIEIDNVEEFLETNPHWELYERFTNNNGLTILKRK
jgi:hypothetical protein